MEDAFAILISGFSGMMLGFYVAVFLALLIFLKLLIKNIWLRWSIIWLIISSLDFLSSYARDDYPDSSLTPFQIAMTLPGDLAYLLILPIIDLRFSLLHFFLICMGRSPFDPRLGLSGAWYGGERGGWAVFLVDFSIDFIICGLLFLSIHLAIFAWISVSTKLQDTTSKKSQG